MSLERSSRTLLLTRCPVAETVAVVFRGNKKLSQFQER